MGKEYAAYRRSNHIIPRRDTLAIALIQTNTRNQITSCEMLLLSLTMPFLPGWLQ